MPDWCRSWFVNKRNGRHAHGIVHSHLAYRQSIIPLTSSSLFWRLKLMKFVSIRTRYGGTSAVLCARNNEEATWGLDTMTRKISPISTKKNGETLTLFSQLSLSHLLPFSFASVCSPSCERIPSEQPCNLRGIPESLQPNVIRIQHALYGCELPCLLRFALPHICQHIWLFNKRGER